MSIKFKLYLVSIIPILSILYLSYSVAQEQLIKIKKINTFEVYLDKSMQVNQLISNLQKERGLSSAYIGKNKNIKEEFSKEIKKTDDSLHKLSKYNDINNLIIKQSKLDEFRNKTINLQNKEKDIFKFYTKTINKLLTYISKLPTITDNNQLSIDSLSLIYLIKAKEFSGQERALGAHIFAKEKFSNESFIKIKALQNQYESEINSFYLLSSDNTKFIFDKVMDKNDQDLKKFKYMEDMLSQNIYKKTIISNIKSLSGYGGLIHNFKNYLLRGDPKYKNRFYDKYNELLLNIREYKKLNTSKEELKLLNSIKETFKEYAYAMNKINVESDKILNIQNIDSKIKISDIKALNALETLSNYIIGIDPAQWIDYATRRIDKIIILEDYIFNNLKNKKEEILNNLTTSFYNKLVLIFLIILITMIAVNKIVKGILKKLDNLKIGLLNFFSFINNENSSFTKLKVDGDDEIDKLAISLNKGIEHTTKYIKEEINKASQKDKQIYESAKMAQMGEMIGNIAHQWRQPLSVVSTIASGIQVKQSMGIFKHETLEDNMNKIVQNTTYLSETIDIFSNFIKEEKIYKNLILQDEIKTAFTIIKSSLTNHHIELKSDIDFNKKIIVKLISGELPQVIINIINNAKDILLEKEIDNAQIVVKLEEQKDKVIISIEDNAGGVPNSIIDKIFDPYFTTKHKSKGTGLGLHMSYKIIQESLHGKLYVKNTNKGAKFFIELPLITK
jgi:signal transduction histidine kinase